MTVPFTDRIDKLEERLLARAFTTATIEVPTSNERLTLKVTAIDAHLAPWYGEEVSNEN